MKVSIVNLTRESISGGYRKYLQEIVPRLAVDGRVEGLEVYASEKIAPTLDIDKSFVISWHVTDASHGFPWLKAAVREARPDVVFIPAALWADFGEAPTMIMVHNMEPLTVPFGGNPTLSALRNCAKAVVARRSCAKADRVIAVSRHVESFLTRRWRVAESKVGMVYHGVEQPLPPEQQRKPDALSDLSPGAFLFTAGSIRTARGLEDVVKALPAVTDRSLRLVIAGSPDPGFEGYRRMLGGLAEREGIAQRILWAGQLSPEEMAWCYAHCRAFVMTSRAEACPCTAQEAMSYGCGVVSTTQPPMPEFFEDFAYYYEPRQHAALARAIDAAMNAGEAEMVRRRTAAITKAASFDWADTARLTADQLEIAASVGKLGGR